MRRRWSFHQCVSVEPPSNGRTAASEIHLRRDPRIGSCTFRRKSSVQREDLSHVDLFQIESATKCLWKWVCLCESNNFSSPSILSIKLKEVWEMFILRLLLRLFMFLPPVNFTPRKLVKREKYFKEKTEKEEKLNARVKKNGKFGARSKFGGVWNTRNGHQQNGNQTKEVGTMESNKAERSFDGKEGAKRVESRHCWLRCVIRIDR